jgi:hypothetical protein
MLYLPWARLELCFDESVSSVNEEAKVFFLDR